MFGGFGGYRRNRALCAPLVCVLSAVATFVFLNDTEAAEHPAKGADLQRQQVSNVAGHARRVALTDPQHGDMPLAEVDVPAGWGYESRVSWSRIPGQSAAHQVVIDALLHEPALGASIHFLPAQAYVSPVGPAQGLQGQLFAGLPVREQQPATEALQGYVGDLHQSAASSVRLISVAPDPGYAQARQQHKQRLLAEMGISDRLVYSGARVELEHAHDGQITRELLRAVVSTHADLETGLRVWKLEHIVSLRAPLRHLRGLESVAGQIIASVKVNPQWAQQVLAANDYGPSASTPLRRDE